MIRSMTGYCSVRETIGEATVSLEIKALNHKSYDLHYHGSRFLSMLEIPFREHLQKNLCRGRIEIFLRTSKPIVPEETIKPNAETARAYMQAAQTLAQELGLPYQPSMESLLRVDGILSVEETQTSTDEYWQMLKGLVDKAVEGLLEMKRYEGQRLQNELESLLGQIERVTGEIVQRREQVIQEYRDKLMLRITDWAGTLELEPNRVIQEVAFYVDRSDIKEETVRLNSHIQQFHKILTENNINGTYCAVGRKLDFLCQELFREANTIGSKSSSIEIVRLSLEIKGIIEQLREQVQNVE